MPVFDVEPRGPIEFRRSVSSFVAQYEGTCGRCHDVIESGQRVRYFDGLGLIHHQHAHVEKPVQVCQTCWLVRPCDC